MSNRLLLHRGRLLIACVLVACGLAPQASAAEPQYAALAETLARLLRDAIPADYEKQQDWGATKQITVGVRPAGKPADLHLKRHKKTVNHGVWKHYKLRLVEPDKNLVVQVTDIHPIEPGRMAFAVHLDAKLDAWARAKVYQYGVHLIALELESDARVQIDLAGEVAMQVALVNGSPGMTVRPKINSAQLKLVDFHLRRVSNAHGPLVHELGDGLRHVIQEEVNGPQLVAKLNQAIDKKRDRLTFTTADLLKTSASK
jgi:hypothetical protein